MRIKNLNANFLFPLLALVILLLALSQVLFNMVPAIGKLLDPFNGFVQNNNQKGIENPDLHFDSSDLRDSVHIYFDERKVPHIYARSQTDLYFAQGYVTAYFRLWQMDFMSYAAGGRLSEIFSDGFLDYDRNQRRIGIPSAAAASLKMVEQDPGTHAIIDAYTRGVNAYIRRLDYKDLPLEYKVLDYSPEPWTNLKTLLIMKSMAGNLSGYEDDLNMTHMMLALGEKKFNMLYPDFAGLITPVAGISHAAPNTSLTYTPAPEYLNYSFLNAGQLIGKSAYDPRLGSNSWAVSGKKTKTGYPILCSDPHLQLSLPSTWIEMQLTTDDMNVYGVSIPGIPALLIGFNEDIAWGITNGDDDARDWYKMTITEDYKKYQMDGQWLDLPMNVEEIKRRGQARFLDTVYHTVQGRLVNDQRYPGRQPGLVNYALQWGLHRPSNELKTFVGINKAKNYDDFKTALLGYSSPIQNFTFASRNNDIAVCHRGSMPVKWPGQGRFLLDGSRRSHLYNKYIPPDSLPREFDPACHYIIAANQHPTDNGYPYYYNGYYSENRANRIRKMLEGMDSLDVPAMQAIQLDNTNDLAVTALPVLLHRIDSNRLNKTEKASLQDLAGWHGTYDLDDQHAELYELWWNYIREFTWDEFNNYSFAAGAPRDQVLLELIRTDPDNEYFRRNNGTLHENAGDILYMAFTRALKEYTKWREQGNKTWGDFHKVDIRSLSNLGLFSRLHLPSAGHTEAVNSISGNVGPSWRMIVQLGKRPVAFGIYPGGQPGNPLSPYYDEFVDDWSRGKYYPLNFFMDRDEARAHPAFSWTLK